MLRTSVIIPTYNRADYLPEALHSVFSQSRAPWEVIVVDDGSRDNTDEVLREFESQVHFLRQDHQGVSAARNLGLHTAKGDVIAWLDADDVWESDFLASVLPMLESNDEVDGVYTGLIRIDAQGRTLPQSSNWSVAPEDLFSSLVENCRIQTSTFAARRCCYDQAGDFDMGFDICEDYDMFLRMAKTGRIVGVPRALVRYRVHEQNTVGDPTAFCRFRLALTEKHFGKPQGDPQTWSDEKRRAHAYAYRTVALKWIEHKQTERGWRYLERAVSIFPGLLERVDTFYELACGSQPVGYRGATEMLDIERNGAEMLHGLEVFFAAADAPMQAWRRLAFGNAYLALGMLSDQAGDWSRARRYLFEAVDANPRLLTSSTVLRRLLKLSAGKRLVAFGRLLGGRQQGITPMTHVAGAQDESQTSH